MHWRVKKKRRMTINFINFITGYELKMGMVGKRVIINRCNIQNILNIMSWEELNDRGRGANKLNLNL